MTDKLKCPFCGYKLNKFYDSDENIVGYFCANPHCRIKADVLEPYVWQALIDGKKARDALNYAIGVLDNLTEIGGVDVEIIKIKKMAGITKQEE